VQTATVGAIDIPAPSGAVTRASVFRTYRLEAQYEFLKLLRTPHYSVPALAFPIMFYLLFGLSFAGRSKGPGVSPAEYLVACYSVFGVVTAALFAFGVGVAMERAYGWLVLKRATPMPMLSYLTAKIVASMLFGTVILLMMATCAVTLGGVHFSPEIWLKLWAVIVLGCVPFCLFGLFIAFVVPPQGAPGIVNLINLPLSFAGGLWMPVEILPKFVQTIAPFLPQYHIGQLAKIAIGAAPGEAPGAHIAILLLTSIVFAALSRVAWKRADADQG
jgi:ABC-2 type transport system permease protein